MRKYSVLIATISALLLALISTPAHASVENGDYICTTGLRTTTETTNVYKITSNRVTSYSSSIKCNGAVVIPEGVTSIGDYAFRSSPALTSITIPPSVTSIGAEAFSNNSALLTVTFAGTSTLGTIGNYAFNSSGLTSITLPASVTSIATSAFFSTKALTSITVADANPNFSTLDSVLFNKGKTSLVQYPAGKPETSYSIPASVTVIEPGAFAFSSALVSITFDGTSTLTTIGSDAFLYASGLTSITIPASVTSIGMCAFCYADELTSITIPASVISIGDGAFMGATKLTSVYFLGNAPTVDYEAFGYEVGGAKAYIKSSATNFGTIGGVWNNLTVAIGVYTASYNSSGGSVVASDAFIENGAISQAPTQPTKSGYTFTGWSATDGGSTITFPYTTPTPSADITLFATWTSEAAPVPVSDPEVSTPVPVPDSTPADPLVSNAAPAIKTAKKASKSIQFSAGSRVLTKAHKSALKKSIKKSGLEATYVVTGTAGMLPGVTNEQVKRLAKLRANAIKAYLVKRGVNESNISIKIKITNQRTVPQTKILAKYSVF